MPSSGTRNCGVQNSCTGARVQHASGTRGQKEAGSKPICALPNSKAH